jgi:hypothetical protein
MDNVTGRMDSDSLCTLLTNPQSWSGKALYSNIRTAFHRVPVVLGTGNHATVSQDLARRICPIQLSPQPEDAVYPHGHDSVFLKWVRSKRPAVLRTLLGMIQGWVANGCKPGAWRLDGFSATTQALSGILDHWGLPAEEWSGNVAAWRDEASDDNRVAEDFLLLWTVAGNSKMDIGELITMAEKVDGLEWVWEAARTEQGRRAKLSKWISGRFRSAVLPHHDVEGWRSSHQRGWILLDKRPREEGEL